MLLLRSSLWQQNTKTSLVANSFSTKSSFSSLASRQEQQQQNTRHSTITRSSNPFFYTRSSTTTKTKRMLSSSSSSIPPEYASAAARRQSSANVLVTNKMCPFAQKTWIALEYSQIPFELKEVSLYGPGGKPSWFLELNPMGQVPVLSAYGGSVVVPDSESILEYILQGKLEGIPGIINPLVVSDKEKRKQINEWRTFVSDKLIPIGKSAVLGNKKSKTQLFDLLSQKSTEIQGPYLCGSEISIADCAVFPFVWRLHDEYNLVDNGCQRWKIWLDECLKEPAFQKTVQSSWWWWW